MSCMRRRNRAFLLAVLSGSLLAVAHPAMAATEAQLVRQSNTSTWSTPSPDPTGLAYVPKNGRFLISDAEVDEGALWRQKNLFFAGRKGGLIATRRVKGTMEPESLVWYGPARSLFVSDDDLDGVFRLTPGRDGAIGTGDDVAKKLLNTRRFGSYDPEGLTWHPLAKMLIFVDATDGNVYKVRRGGDLRFGTRDDTVKRFGTFKFGFTDPEGVTWDPVTKHLFIVSSRNKYIIETDMNGVLIRTINMPFCGAGCNISDLVFAPGTDGSRRRLYLTDRGKDNNAYPNPSDYNDGKLYQVRFVNV
jgi:DNA-binding beta-propeller fold protein YncE